MNAVQETVGSTINPILIGPGVDERYARNDVSGRAYFLSDALNSTIALTSSTGAIQNQYSYDPYGNVTASNATFTNPYQFMGREADTPGLYYYRARYYSPMMAGFISEDPIGFGGGQLSFYAAFGSDPVGNTDPSGLESPRAACGVSNNSTSAWAGCATPIPECDSCVGCYGLRAPDFALFNINIYVFSAYAEYSKDGNAFVGGAVNFNSPNPLNIDASANAGWLNSFSPPSGAQIDNFLGGYSGGGTAGYAGAGGGEVWSPGNGTATVIGFGAGEQYQSNYKGNGNANWGYTVPTGQTGITW